MPRAVLPALAILIAAACAVPASAAERTVAVTSFDKVRVQGPFEVRVATGRAPAATLSGDAAAIDGIAVESEGATIILRNAIGRWQERPRAAAAVPVVVTLATPTLVTASVVGADAANATVIGAGAITIGGRAGRVRLMTNGPGTIDAAALDTGDLVVRLDGPGATRARARYTASIVNTGLGQIAVAGAPKCTVRADAGGPVACGGVR